jgi:hypothetical protein
MDLREIGPGGGVIDSILLAEGGDQLRAIVNTVMDPRTT